MSIWVIDTNILISALITRTSKQALLVAHASKRGNIAFSAETFREIELVSWRSKFSRYADEARRKEFLSALQETAQYFTPTESVQLCRDADDNKFLELAAACEAEYLITGDRDLLALAHFRKTEIITPSSLLSRIHP